MRILIAEDDAVTRKLLEGMVKRLGHEVLLAHHGGEALAHLEADEPPELALLDWVMPVMTGPEVCSTLLRSRPVAPQTYLILVTAKWRRSDIVEGLRSGANDYVMKPFDPDELTARIDMGIRVTALERRLRARMLEMKLLAERLRTAESLLPSCAGCRTHPGAHDDAWWSRLEDHLRKTRGGATCESCEPACVR